LTGRKLREQCKSKEKRVDMAVLGLQTEGPKGDSGPPGAPGSPDTAAQVEKLTTVDGSGSGVDAD
jgi:hypothetical protein